MTKVPERVREAYRELPSGWKLEKLKFFANIRNSNVDKTIAEDEEPVRLCNYTDVYYNDRITADLHFMDGSATEAEIARFQLKRNQVIITKDSEGWDDIGIPALVATDMPRVLCGYHLSVLEPGPDLDGSFLAWLCRAEPLNDQFKLTANGVTRFGLGQYAMKNAFIALPPLHTQRRIARFLDEKTAWIDGLIEKKRELLDRLAEKRQALVTLAVTKGLEPDALVNPSGIERLGNTLALQAVRAGGMSYFGRSDELPEWVVPVPAGWGSNWLKWSVDLSTRRPTEAEQEVLPYISNEDIESWTGKLLIEEPKPTKANCRMFKENDVLFNKLRPYLAKVYHARCDGVSSGELLCLRPSSAVEPRFLFYVLVSKGFIDMINAETFGAKMPRADWEIVGHQPLPLPPLGTQQRIARFLDQKTAQIDGLVEKIRISVERLAEYRSAQITAAVTGQLTELR